MGLLNRLDRASFKESKKPEFVMPEFANFTFQPIDEKTKEYVLSFWKRLFIRGTLGGMEEYSSSCNLCVRDIVNDITCFKQGESKEETYFCLLVKGEMWRVISVLTDLDGEAKCISHIEVVYIPSKIGKTLGCDASALKFATMAVEKLVGIEMTEYISGLKSVLDEDSVKEYSERKESWYDEIFEDENCRQFRDFQASKIKEMEANNKDIEFSYKLLEANRLVEYKKILDEKITENNYVFSPKIGVKADSENAMIFKYMANGQIDNINGIQYYALFLGNALLLIGSIENPENGDVSVEKITTFGYVDCNSDTLHKLIAGAIEKIQKVWYYQPKIKCTSRVHTEICAGDNKVEL